MKRFDYCIIGGGVVGCAILNKLTRLGKTACLIEKESDVGMGSSKANSGIIHTGFDCKTGTLKAKLNARGFNLYEDILKRLNVEYKVNGHLVVGNDLEKIKELYQRGVDNGVKNLSICKSDLLQQLEPNLNKDIKYGLYAKNGMIVSSYELSVAFCEEAIINGAEVFLTTEVKSSKTEKDGIVLSLSDGREFGAGYVINSAGAGYNEVSKILGSEEYPLEFRRGEYYIIDRGYENFCSHTIFPLPTAESKGILITNTASGNILVGPTSYLSDNSTKTTELGLQEVKNKALDEMPNLPLYGNIRVFSGVRNISGKDFIIEKSKTNPFVINLVGICSPGLSSAPAIAEFVAELLGLDYTKEYDGLKTLKPKLRIRNLSIEEQDKLIKKNPKYGEIVCKCEEISLGEIEDAILSPLGAKTVDAVKRRTRAGMGRCQSGFCIFKVMENLAKLNNANFNDIEKDAIGSKIIHSSIKPNKGGF